MDVVVNPPKPGDPSYTLFQQVFKRTIYSLHECPKVDTEAYPPTFYQLTAINLLFLEIFTQTKQDSLDIVKDNYS